MKITLLTLFVATLALCSCSSKQEESQVSNSINQPVQEQETLNGAQSF